MPQTNTNSTVEERIVEMRFDNKQFESGVKQTMSTLDKLKEKLVFKNDVKGLDNIQNSINRIDLSVAMRGIDAFQQKLSALQIFGKRIVENLADDFYGAIKKVENGIRGVFQQISTGGAKRALNIEQAKFQLEGLHIAWEDIKGDIDYAVSGTAYGLDAAARVAAQLSASQVQVGDDMKAALRGISGVAAMTNSSYEDIGRIFSQVAGAGRLYTQDMLQMSSRGLNIAAALGQQLGHTEAEIREMVTKGQIDFKTFATAMNEAFGEQATKANNTYTGSLSNVKAALSRLGADIKAGHFETFRQVFVDLIPKLNEFKKAFKPVENVIIEVEAAVGKLLQKLISMVDVTKLVSRIAKPIEKVGKRILEVVDVVTAALDQVDAPLKAMQEFVYVSREAAMQMSGFGDAVKSTAKDEKEALNLTEDMQKAYQAAQDIWNTGKYGNGQQRIDALRAAGIDPDKTQAIIEEFIKNGGNWEEAIKKVSETTSEAVDENSEKAEKLTKKVQTLATIFRNIKRTFKAVATSIGNVVSALFKSVTGSMEKFGVGDILIKITGKIADLAEKFVITKEKAEKLTKPVNVLLSVLKTIVKVGAGVVKFVINLIANTAKLIYSLGKVIYESETFQKFITNLKNGFAKIGKGISDLVKTARESEGLKKFASIMKTIGGTILNAVLFAITKIVDAIGWAIPKIGSFFAAVGTVFSSIFGGVMTVGSKIGDFFKSIIDSIKTGNFIKDLKAKFDFLGEPNAQQEVGTSIFTKIFGFIKGVFDWVVKMFDQHTLDEYLVVIKELISITTLLATMSLIKNIQKLAKNGISLLGSIDKVLKSTAKVNKSIANLNNAKAFAQIAKVILAFAASVSLIMFTVMKTADYISSSEAAAQAFETAVNTVKDMMGKVFLSILGIIAALKSIDLAISMFTSKTKLHVPVLLQFGVFMFSVGYAIKQVVKAMTDLYDMKDEVFQKGGKRLMIIAGGIGAFFAGLTLIVSVINKFLGGGGSSETTKGLYAMSLVLISMALSVDVLMAAVSWMSMMIMGYGTETVDKAVDYVKSIIRTIMIMLSILVGSMAFLEHFGSQQDLAKTFGLLSLLFLSIGASLIGIMIVINDLTLSLKLFPSETQFAIISVIIAIAAILGEMIALVSTAAKINDKGVSALKSLIGIVLALDALMLIIGVVAHLTDNDTKLAAIGAMLIGLIGLVASMALLVRNMGSNKLKAKNILSVAVVFASLGVVLGSLLAIAKIPSDRIGMALTTLSFVVFTMQYVIRAATRLDKEAFKNVLSLGAVFASLGVVIFALKVLTEQPVENIATAMGGLALVVYAMSKVIEAASGLKNKAYKNIAALFLAFVGVGAMLVPLALLKGEDWPGYLAAMGGLAAVVGAFGFVLKAIDATMTVGKIIAVGGAIGIISASFALLAGVLGYMSTIVDTEKLITIAVTVGLLGAAMGLIVVLLAKSGPTTLSTIVSITVSIIAVSAAILGVIYAINLLVERFPEFQTALQGFAYTIGTLPGFLIKGFIAGIDESFPKLGKLIHKLIGDYVVEPAEDELGIASPSKVFMQIGEYVGEGLEIGLKDKLKNLDLSAVADFGSNLKDSIFENTSGITDAIGGGLFNNLGSSLNLDGLSNFDGYLSDGVSNTDFSKFSDSMGIAIGDAVEDGVRGVDYTKVFSLDDLLADNSLYEQLKSEGESQLTSAYEDWQRHAEFMAKYPTFQSWIDNIEDNYAPSIVKAYRDGDEEIRSALESMMIQNYTDQSKLSAETYKYTRAAQTKAINDAIAEGSKELGAGAGVAGAGLFKMTMNLQDSDGNTLRLGDVESLFKGDTSSSIGLNLNDTQLQSNLSSVSGDISTVVNAQGDKIAQKLEYINNRVTNFDNNQSNRTQNIMNKISEMESVINNIQLRLDTGAIVGQLVGPMDSALGERQRRKARG